MRSSMAIKHGVYAMRSSSTLKPLPPKHTCINVQIHRRNLLHGEPARRPNLIRIPRLQGQLKRHLKDIVISYAQRILPQRHRQLVDPYFLPHLPHNTRKGILPDRGVLLQLVPMALRKGPLPRTRPLYQAVLIRHGAMNNSAIDLCLPRHRPGEDLLLKGIPSTICSRKSSGYRSVHLRMCLSTLSTVLQLYAQKLEGSMGLLVAIHELSNLFR